MSMVFSKSDALAILPETCDERLGTITGHLECAAYCIGSRDYGPEIFRALVDHPE